MYRFAFATSDEEARNDRKAIADLCARSGVAKPPEDAKFYHVEVSNHQLSWWYGGEPLKAV